MSRTRAADDFATIRARLDELRRESPTAGQEDSGDPQSAQRERDSERYRRERMEGFPPPWVPTIFLRKMHA